MSYQQWMQQPGQKEKMLGLFQQLIPNPTSRRKRRKLFQFFCKEMWREYYKQRNRK